MDNSSRRKKIFFGIKFVLLFFNLQSLRKVNPGPCYYGSVKALFQLKYKSKHFFGKNFLPLKVVHEITVPNKKIELNEKTFQEKPSWIRRLILLYTLNNQ